MRKIALITALFLASTPAIASDNARFSVRGAVSGAYVNSITGNWEATVFVGADTYTVVCPGASCAGLMLGNVGKCVDVYGYLSVLVPPRAVILHADYVARASYCPSHRALFQFIGHIVSYIPPTYDRYGQLTKPAEFDIEANNQIYRGMCDPRYRNCMSAIGLSMFSGKCTSTYGSMDAVVIGFVGDTTVINWTVDIHTFSGVECP